MFPVFLLIHNEIPWFSPKKWVIFPDMKNEVGNSLIFPDAGHPESIVCGFLLKINLVNS